jgi:hypothetical protein
LTRQASRKGTRRLLWAAWIALAALFAETRARAKPAGVPVGADQSFPIGLDWERERGAESCIGEDALRRSVETLLQRRIFAPLEQTAVSIRGRVLPGTQRFLARLALVVGDGSVVGERTLESETADCASLDQRLSLVIALAIDSLRALPKSTLRLDERPNQKWFGEVALAVSYERALLPAPTIGFGVNARLQPPSFWPIELGAFGWPFPTTARLPSGPGAEVIALGARAGLCPWLVQGASLGLRLCVDAQAGRFMAKGVSVDNSRSPSSWMIGAAARFALWVPLGRRFALEPAVGAFVPFLQYRFTYTDESGQEQRFYQEPPAALLLELAFPLRIP